MADLEKLPAFDATGNLRVVVEAPRGAQVKTKYDPSLGAFVYGRPLPLGLAYPHDWGFIPGTKAEDGDPVDALVLSDVASFAGVVIPCRALGVVQLDQRKDEGRGRERNDRVVLVPVDNDRLARLRGPRDLHAREREEIEQFFSNVAFFGGKDVRLHGWKGAAEALRLVRRAVR